MPRTEMFNREEVIKRAAEVFWAHGYNATSMQDLVDATGLNRSSIYNSFGNKMALYRVCLKDYDKGSQEFIRSTCDENLSAIKKLRWIFDTTVQVMVQDKEDKGCMMINCRTEMGNQEAAIDQILGKSQEQMIRHFRELITKAQLEKEILIARDANELAHFIFSSFQGLRLMGMVTKDRKTLMGVTDHIFNSLK